MSPKSTMSFAQKLYENGLITYMRTDSVTISGGNLGCVKAEKVIADYGEKYSKKTQYKNKSSNSQEIRAIPSSPINKFEIKRYDNARLCDNCVKLYNLIWRRTIASHEPSRGEYSNNYSWFV